MGLLLSLFSDDPKMPALDLLENIARFVPPTDLPLVIQPLTRGIRELLQPQDPHSPCWGNLCRCLSVTSRLFIPHATEECSMVLHHHGGSWQRLFLALWAHRHRFIESKARTKETQDYFHLETFCRFRPATGIGYGQVSVCLPLYQKVLLFRKAHPEIPQQEAVKRLLSRNGQENEAPDCTVKTSGAEDMNASILSIKPGTHGSVFAVAPGCGFRNFRFNGVIDNAASQSNVYEQCGLPMVVDFINGSNGAIICYGQTGSGKTYTVFGPPHSDVEDVAHQDSHGLAERVAKTVLGALDHRRIAGLETRLTISYVEIFGNAIRNLIQDQAVGVHSAQNARMGHRYLLKGELGLEVSTPEEFRTLLKKGNDNRRWAATKINETSSRSHNVLVFRLQQGRVVSSLFLVDLGGSERVSRSGAGADVKGLGGVMTNGEELHRVSFDEYYASRRRITETTNINKGLLSLKRCIRDLVISKRNLAKGLDIKKMIPYRDSKLTEVLEPALSGLAARTAVIICCSSDKENAEETVQSLRFGEMCRLVEHEQTDTMDISGALADALGRINDEIEEVEKLIRQKERWEWRETVRTDIVDANDEATTRVVGEEMELGGLGAVEILPADEALTDRRTVEHRVWGEMLVGAEEEHERMEALLLSRRQLLGENNFL